MRVRLLGLATLAIVALAAVARADTPAPKGNRQSLVLMSVTRGEGYSEKQGRTVEELLLTALNDTGHFKVMGQSDIATMLSVEGKRQAAGCNDASCQIEIAGVLGSDLVASSDLARLDKSTVLSLKVLSVRATTVVARAQVTFKSDDELIAVTRALANQIVSAMGLSAPARQEPSAPEVRRVGIVEPPRADAPRQNMPTVAVLYFDYDGENPQWIGLRKGLAQMLITDLSSLGDVQIVERARLQDVLAELKLAAGNQIDRASAAKIGKLLGARYLVMGGYFDLMGSLRVDARVVEVETGRIVRSTGAHAAADKFLDLEQQLAQEIERTLLEAVPPPPGVAPSSPPRFPLPQRLDATVVSRYGEALDAIDRGDRSAADRAVKVVLQQAPDFALAAHDLSKS